MNDGPGYSAPQKSSWLLPALLIGSALFISAILFVGIISAGFILGFQRGRARRIARVTPSAGAPLSQRYTSKNGMITMHYPADFAAQNLDETTIMLQRSLPGSHVEIALAAGIRSPVSDDLEEFTRVLLVDHEKFVATNGGSWRETRRMNAVCVGGLPGLRVEGEQTFSTGTISVTSACFAIHDGHGYEFKTNVPKASAAAELPLLNHILNATELN